MTTTICLHRFPAHGSLDCLKKKTTGLLQVYENALTLIQEASSASGESQEFSHYSGAVPLEVARY